MPKKNKAQQDRDKAAKLSELQVAQEAPEAQGQEDAGKESRDKKKTWFFNKYLHTLPQDVQDLWQSGKVPRVAWLLV